MTVLEILGWALVHSLWQDVLVAASLASLLAIIPSHAARTRYALATAALVLLLALPLATALRPVSAVDAVYWLTVHIGGRIEPALPWLASVWFAGVAIMAVRLAYRWQSTRRLALAKAQQVPARFREALARLARRLQVGRPVHLVASTLVHVPAVLGWFRPVILLPVSVVMGGGLTPLQLDALLAHELAHVRRHDYLFNLLQSVIETLLFYHPAAWWVSARMRDEREQCCDDLAVATCGDVHTYASALVAMDQLRTSRVLAVAANGGSLLRRVSRLVRPDLAVSRGSRWMTGFAVLALLLTVLLGGHWGRALASSGDLITLATDARHARVRSYAVEQLGRTKDPRALHVLIAVAQRDPSRDVRDEAVESLGTAFPDTATVRVLARIARHDRDERVAKEAVETLGEMRDGLGLREVVQIARTHPDPNVRRKAIKSIRDDAPRSTALPILREIALHDRDAEVQRRAERALAKLGEL